MAASSGEFQQHFTPGDWSQVQERSLQIEQEQKEREKDKERQKKAKALEKTLERQAGPPLTVLEQSRPAAASRSIPGSQVAPKPTAKPAVKPKAAPKSAKSGGGSLKGLATGNRFGGLGDGDDSDSADEGDGWTTVKK